MSTDTAERIRKAREALARTASAWLAVARNMEPLREQCAAATDRLREASDAASGLSAEYDERLSDLIDALADYATSVAAAWSPVADIVGERDA
jgi:beta-mannanase